MKDLLNVKLPKGMPRHTSRLWLEAWAVYKREAVFLFLNQLLEGIFFIGFRSKISAYNRHISLAKKAGANTMESRIIKEAEEAMGYDSLMKWIRYNFEVSLIVDCKQNIKDYHNEYYITPPFYPKEVTLLKHFVKELLYKTNFIFFSDPYFTFDDWQKNYPKPIANLNPTHYGIVTGKEVFNSSWDRGLIKKNLQQGNFWHFKKLELHKIMKELVEWYPLTPLKKGKTLGLINYISLEDSLKRLFREEMKVKNRKVA